MRSGKLAGAQRLGGLNQGAGAGKKWQGAKGRLAQDDTELARLHASGVRRSVRHHDKKRVK